MLAGPFTGVFKMPVSLPKGGTMLRVCGFAIGAAAARTCRSARVRKILRESIVRLCEVF